MYNETAIERVRSDAPFKFLIKSIKGEFIDPNNIVLYLQFKVWRKGDGGVLKKLEQGENVAPYNGFLYTMFKVWLVKIIKVI